MEGARQLAPRKSLPSASERLFEAYAGSVYRWALFLGIDEAGAEEVVQEVFITAFQRIDTVESDAQIPSWLFQVTRRHAANYRRNAWVKRIFRKVHTRTEEELFVAPRENEETSLQARRILGDMPLKLVEILILHDMDGYTREEISEQLGLRPGTVASRLRKARSVFAAAWDPTETP